LYDAILRAIFLRISRIGAANVRKDYTI